MDTHSSIYEDVHTNTFKQKIDTGNPTISIILLLCVSMASRVTIIDSGHESRKRGESFKGRPKMDSIYVTPSCQE